MKKLLALFMCLTIIASCASVSVCAAEIENLAGGPFNFEDVDDTTADITPFTNAKVVDKTAAGVDFESANGSNVLKLSGNSNINFSEAGINSGIIEFTTDWYACNVDSDDKVTYGVQMGVGAGNKALHLFRLVNNETGAVAGANGGWSLTGGNNNVIPRNKWQTLKVTVNVDGDKSWYELAYKDLGADDSTYKNIYFQHASYIADGKIYDDFDKFQALKGKNYNDFTDEQILLYDHAKEMSDNTTYTYEKRYYLDGVIGYSVKKDDTGKITTANNNPNQKILSDITMITFVGDVKYNLYDNTSVKVYEPFYTAINKCTTADEVKTQLKLYKNLGMFDFGSEYTKVDDMSVVFKTLIGKNFGSDADVTNAYNAAVAANVNPYISERYVMDDITENTIFTGEFVSDSQIKADGKFFKPTYASRTGRNFNTPVTEGIIKYNSDVYVNYKNSTETSERITPFAINVAKGTGYDSDSTGAKMFEINRVGSFSLQSAAWAGDYNTVKLNQWTNVEGILDVESKSLRINADKKPILLPRSYSDYKDVTISNSYVYKYDGETNGNNAMGILPSTIYGLRFTNNSGEKALNYLDNLDITVYKPLYKVINEASDAESLAKAIDFYSNELKVFTKSDKEYSAEKLYNALKVKSYSNSKEFADAYNNYVSTPVLTLGNITFNNGYPRYTNIMVNTTSVTVKKDDVSYIALYAADGSLNGVYELPRITGEKITKNEENEDVGDGQRTYTYGDCITLVDYDKSLTNNEVIISQSDWNNAATAKVFIWSKDSEDSAIIPVANSVKIK